jgi:anaerobic ribonucleoside-triphosphate reductase
MASICKKCLLREMAEADAKMIKTYLEAIKKRDRVDSLTYEKRLAVCKKCDLLNAGTCGACGCYVELRAAAVVGRCPYKKWHE